MHMHDQRITSRLVTYWKLLAKEQKFPEIQQFNNSAVQDIWPQCMKVNISVGRDITYKYEYMGEEVVRAYGRDLTGFTVDFKMKQFPGAAIFKNLEQVIHDPKPLEDEGHLVNRDGKMMKWRACFLPFGSHKRGLTHVIVGLSFRVF